MRSPGAPGEIGSAALYAKMGEQPPGPFRAKVMDVDDPDKQGRIRVFIYAVMQGPETDESQWTGWVAPQMPVDGFSVPAVGSLTWIEFEIGTFDYPVYSGSYYRKNRKPPKLAIGEDDGEGAAPLIAGGTTVPGSQSGSSTYPKNRVLRTPGGLTVELDDTGDGRIRVAHPNGTYIEMRNDGDLTVRASEDVAVGGATIKIVGSSGIVLAVDGPGSLQAGGATAVSPVVLATPYLTAMSAFVAALNTFASALGSGTGIDPVTHAQAATAATALATALSALNFPGTVSIKLVAE